MMDMMACNHVVHPVSQTGRRSGLPLIQALPLFLNSHEVVFYILNSFCGCGKIKMSKGKEDIM